MLPPSGWGSDNRSEVTRACPQLSQMAVAARLNAGQEASCGLVVAGGNGPKLLELGEEVLDQMPGLVEVFVKGARCLPGIPSIVRS